MTESGNLQQSLSTMGLVELALAFAALAGYGLALNPLLGSRGRLRAGALALVAASGFIVMTRPWVNGFILVVLAVAGIGVFTAVVWAVSAACGLTQAVPASDGEPAEAIGHENLRGPAPEPASAALEGALTASTRAPGSPARTG